MMRCVASTAPTSGSEGTDLVHIPRLLSSLRFIFLLVNRSEEARGLRVMLSARGASS